MKYLYLHSAALMRRQRLYIYEESLESNSLKKAQKSPCLHRPLFAVFCVAEKGTLPKSFAYIGGHWSDLEGGWRGLSKIVNKKSDEDDSFLSSCVSKEFQIYWPF